MNASASNPNKSGELSSLREVLAERLKPDTDVILREAFPSWLEATPAVFAYLGEIIYNFASTELLIDMLITCVALGSYQTEEATRFRDKVLSNMLFHEKTTVLFQEYDFQDDGKLNRKLKQLQNYRNAVAHPKKGEPLLAPTADNRSKFKDLSGVINSRLAAMLVEADSTHRDSLLEALRRLGYFDAEFGLPNGVNS